MRSLLLWLALVPPAAADPAPASDEAEAEAEAPSEGPAAPAPAAEAEPLAEAPGPPLPPASAGPIVLTERVASFLEVVHTLDAASCPTTLNGWFADLEAIDPANVDMADVQAHGEQLVQDTFRIELAVHALLQRLYADGTLDAPCMAGIRRADLAARYLGDYLLEAAGHDDEAGLWLVNPAFEFAGPADIADGDTLVSRATLISSAGIAHMGNVDSQFSHNLGIHVDDKGVPRTIEAYLEAGGYTQKLEKFLPNEIGRVVVLRFEDREAASKGMEAAWRRIKKGRPIEYDEAFDYEDHSQLFCSEVPRWTLGELAGRAEDVPIDLALTRLEVDDNRPLFDAMGVPTAVTSAPADVLYDPRFEIVAEWRNTAELRNMRLHDATVESLMSWMSDKGYELHPSKAERSLIHVALFIRRIPLLGSALKKKLHPRGEKPFLITSLALQNAAIPVYEELVEELEGRERELIPYTELRAILETIRERDLERWKIDPDSAHFHHLLRPQLPQKEAPE